MSEQGWWPWRWSNVMDLAKKTIQYVMEYRCRNCGMTVNLNIDKGNGAPQTEQFTPCSYCGCERLDRVGRPGLWGD